MSGFNLSEWALRHRSVVVYFMIVAVIAGTISYFRLGRNEDPTFIIKTMVVQAAWPFSVAGVALAVGTGPLLFVVQPAEYLVNRAFFWKLLLLCAALANVALFHASFAGVLRGARPVVRGVRVQAVLSLLLWLGVLLAGRMIAFV